MQQSNQPPKYVIPFAQNDASKATIPPTSADDTRASQSQGFPPRTGLPPEAGGVPPQKADMNGALNQLAGPILWSLAGGRFPFDNAFATDSNIGGYPLGSNLPAADGRGEWYSTSNDNTVNPDTVGTGWVPGYHYGSTALVGQTGGNVPLTPAQAAKRTITVAGTLTSNLVLIVPAWVYSWTIYNNTSGAFSVSVRTAAGSAAAIPQNGAPTPVVCDGTNCSLLAPNLGTSTSSTQAATVAQTSGRLLRTSLYYRDEFTNVQTVAVDGGPGSTTGAGVFTPLAQTQRVRVRCQGAGGAGGGAGAQLATSFAAGGGGAAGAYSESIFSSGFSSVAITVGTGGVGVAGAAGGNGTGSSFGALASAPGGTGGAPGTSYTAPSIAAGGTSPTAVGNVFQGAGAAGSPSVMLSNAAITSGAGGASAFGGGGMPRVNTSGTGGAGFAYGSGGAGATAQNSIGAQLGGSGGSGCIIVEEYA